jgi:PKD repeat protein
MAYVPSSPPINPNVPINEPIILADTDNPTPTLPAPYYEHEITPTPYPFVTPIADFEYRVLADGDVEFRNTTHNYYTDCYWDFGDGDFSTLSNPTHRYAFAGTYTVRLDVYNGVNTSFKSRSVVVTIEVHEVDFSYLKSGLNVSFTDTSTIAGDIRWDFGDGHFSYESPAMHSYAVAGTYNVVLWVDNRYKMRVITVTEGEESYTYDRTVTLEDYCYDAHNFKIGPDENIYFVSQNIDTCGAHGVIFNPEGELVSIVGFGQGCGNGEFQDIFDIAASSTKILISEYGRGVPVCPEGTYPERSTRVQAFRQSDKSYYFQYWEGFVGYATPYLAVDEPNNKIYHLRGLDLVITGPTGNYITEVNFSNGSSDGEFLYQPGCIRFYENEIYIEDSGNYRINVFDSDGIFDRSIAYAGSYFSSFDIFSDRIYIADEDENRIYIMDMDGVIFLEFGTSGTGDGELNNPVYAFANNSYLYVVDRGADDNTRLQLFASSSSMVGLPVSRFTADIYQGVAPLTVFFTDSSEGEPTSYLYEFGDGETAAFSSGEHIFDNPGIYGVRQTVTNALGSDSSERTIIVYDQIPVTPPDDGNIIYWIQVGNYYYAIDFINHRILIYDIYWTLQQYFGAIYLNEPTYLVAFDECILVIDQYNSNITVFDLDGNYQSAYGSFGTANDRFSAPFSIGTNGVYVYVADTVNKRIQFFTFDETTCSILAYAGTVALDYEPYGIGFDNNFMFVIDKTKCFLNIYTFSGEIVKAYAITCGYEYMTVGNGVITMWGDEDTSMIMQINPDFQNPETDEEYLLTLYNNIAGIELKKLLLTMNILNPYGETNLQPLQLTMNIHQYLQPMILTMNILPDCFTEYKKNPQFPTDEIT